jgi:alpha-D-ribose 1-methylphosphonate 5-triphosphate synthase subunit PhnH
MMEAAEGNAVLPGFQERVGDAQRVFRTVLDAMAAPGTIHRIDVDITPPPPLDAAAAGFFYALADYDTPIWIAPSLKTDAVVQSLQFHCGAPLTEDAGAAAFAVTAGDDVGLDRFQTGDDEFPENGATVLVAVDGLSPEGPLVCTGPGIEETTGLGIAGLDDRIWQEWSANGKLFPRGRDLVFTCGGALVCLPRTTRVTRRG